MDIAGRRFWPQEHAPAGGRVLLRVLVAAALTAAGVPGNSKGRRGGSGGGRVFVIPASGQLAYLVGIALAAASRIAICVRLACGAAPSFVPVRVLVAFRPACCFVLEKPAQQ